MSSKFKRIVILGSGSLAAKCALHLLQFNMPLTFYESGATRLTKFKNTADQHGIMYFERQKEEIFADLAAIREKTAVISISCNYIIPKRVIDNEFLFMINYHNALLPKHPGRNAEAWAIYEQDEKSGITWHLIDEKVDTGDIIIQREIPIEESMSSLSLLRLQNQLAFDAFRSMIGDLLECSLITYKQDPALREKLHLSTDVPNNGFLDVTWSIAKMQAFLRAMDYGPIRTMGQSKIILNGNTCIWEKTLYYDMVNEPDCFIYEEKERCVLIVKSGKAVKLIGVYADRR